ncbi:hypothetical protein MTR_3g085150 [Medicago truncatula]|uniref:Uncharacterized protein n=1 Tax=Medicago truncatula TaxID=3880 RepID=G7JBG0_MEDTR|nr:hypothetical protein MTR_3g085150 [Medicago truncatula]
MEHFKSNSAIFNMFGLPFQNSFYPPKAILVEATILSFLLSYNQFYTLNSINSIPALINFSNPSPTEFFLSATVAIHNFIRRKAENDMDFNVYEDESTVIHHDDSSSNLDQSQVLNVVSSSEMDRVQNIIRNEIIEHRQNN